jgi:hypothetical protein
MLKTKKPTRVGFFIKLAWLLTLQQQEQQQLARKQQEQQPERKQQLQRQERQQEQQLACHKRTRTGPTRQRSER